MNVLKLIINCYRHTGPFGYFSTGGHTNLSLRVEAEVGVSSSVDRHALWGTRQAVPRHLTKGPSVNTGVILDHGATNLQKCNKGKDVCERHVRVFSNL